MATARTLKLDADTGYDLAVEHGRLVISEDTAAVAQSALTRIRMVRGEWFADLSQGVPYVGVILKKPDDLPLVRSIFREVTQETPGVQDVVSMTFDLDRSTRSLSMDATIAVDGTEVTFREVLINIA